MPAFKTDPAELAEAVTPSDSANLSRLCRGLYVGGAGDVAVKDLSGNSVTLVGALAGSVLPIRCVQLLSTGTSATNVVALY